MRLFASCSTRWPRPPIRTSLASRELARALVAGAPAGCEVEGIVPAGAAAFVDEVAAEVPGLARVHRSRSRGASWLRLCSSVSRTGIGGGMLHSPTLFAPLVKHDRVHDNDQTVVTLWDLRAWEAPDELGRGSAGWQRAMLKRAVKHADAVVVPTHSMAARLEELAPKLGERVRVIAGAAPAGFAVPSDEVGRRRVLDVPEGFVLLSGGPAASDGLALGFAAVAQSGLDVPVLVIDAGEGEEPGIAELAAAAGIPERNLHVRGIARNAPIAPRSSGPRSRFSRRRALVVPLARRRGADAGRAGHRRPVAGAPRGRSSTEGCSSLRTPRRSVRPGALCRSGSTAAAERLGVLAGDRGRVFSWRDAADRVWQLHADLDVPAA